MGLDNLIGLDRQAVIVLDALRKQRNVADYSGDIVPDSAVTECLTHAEILFHDVKQWIKDNKPELIE